MIRSFRDGETASIYRREATRRFSVAVQKLARRKLLMIDAAEDAADLRVPPGNRFEKLKGDRGGQYSIRVNDQYRLCFRWSGADAYDVELVDYH